MVSPRKMKYPDRACELGYQGVWPKTTIGVTLKANLTSAFCPGIGAVVKRPMGLSSRRLIENGNSTLIGLNADVDFDRARVIRIGRADM